MYKFFYTLKWFTNAFVTDRTLKTVLNTIKYGSVSSDEVRYLLMTEKAFRKSKKVMR